MPRNDRLLLPRYVTRNAWVQRAAQSAEELSRTRLLRFFLRSFGESEVLVASIEWRFELSANFARPAIVSLVALVPVLPLAHVVFSELVLELLLAAEVNADLQQFLLFLCLNVELLGVLGIEGS